MMYPSRYLAYLASFSLSLSLFVLTLAPSNPALAGELDQQFRSMRFRCIGPFRAGRSLAVASHPSDRLTYYFGATGGGVFKSSDGGDTWVDVTDTNFRTSSIGAITIAPSDPNVVYVGTGETDIRGNISMGDGMYRSTDAGSTWSWIGLKESHAIADIVVHPDDPNTVLVSAMGHVFGTNSDRGIFKTTDAGANWKKVLFRNDSTGGLTLKMDPTNPRILYASLWQAYRTPFSMSSGGKGSGLFKSTDGGDTWKELTSAPGMPKGIIGKICVDVSPAQKNLVWAMIENENGGLFKSTNGGTSWQRTSSDANIRQRPWYFNHVYADPKNADVVYVLNVGLHKSINGGNSFSGIGTNHGDHHDLWIDPNDPKRMILADDGGAVVSFDGGEHWTRDDVATAQFYHVAVDNHFPYRLYGAQQDNSTCSIPSRVVGNWSIDERQWYSVAGFESGYVIPHPSNKDITVGGNYSGYLGWQDRSIDQERDISVYPNNPVGEGAKDRSERFQWTFPIQFSPHNENVLYTTSQHVWRSTNNGGSWTKLSNDLTKNDTTKQVPSGGPITKDNTGVEVYNTIFTFAESSVTKGVLWAGSDDGLIHVSTNDGASWTNVTPSSPWGSDDALVSMIEPSPHDGATAYAAINRYKLDDAEPYIYRTTNHGASWTRITTGIPVGAFVRVVREDPFRRGLLYAGTEHGLYVSFNNGASWDRLRLNLPLTPIHDLQIQRTERDLVIATHGRSFWILDDLTPLHSFAISPFSPFALYAPRPTIRVEGGSWFDPHMNVGENAPNGALIHYVLPDTTSKEITLTIRDADGDSVITFSSIKDAKGEPFKIETSFHLDSLHRASQQALTTFKGLNTFRWNLRYPDAETLEGAIMWGGSSAGPRVLPGRYSATLKIGTDSSTVELNVLSDPRVKTSPTDLQTQFDVALQMQAKVSVVHRAVKRIRTVKQQVSGVTARFKDLDTNLTKDARELAKIINDTLTSVENELVQTKAKAGQDLLNYPVKLNNKLASLVDVVSSADFAPTQQSIDLFNSLAKQADIYLATIAWVESEKIVQFNAAVDALKLPAIAPPKDGK